MLQDTIQIDGVTIYVVSVEDPYTVKYWTLDISEINDIKVQLCNGKVYCWLSWEQANNECVHYCHFVDTYYKKHIIQWLIRSGVDAPKANNVANKLIKLYHENGLLAGIPVCFRRGAIPFRCVK